MLYTPLLPRVDCSAHECHMRPRSTIPQLDRDRDRKPALRISTIVKNRVDCSFWLCHNGLKMQSVVFTRQLDAGLFHADVETENVWEPPYPGEFEAIHCR